MIIMLWNPSQYTLHPNEQSTAGRDGDQHCSLDCRVYMKGVIFLREIGWLMIHPNDCYATDSSISKTELVCFKVLFEESNKLPNHSRLSLS